MSAIFGPYATEHDTMATPLGAEIRKATPELGYGRAITHAHLVQACHEAGVELGAYDQRILAWLANYEPSTVQVVIGLISRAHAAGLASGRALTVWQRDVLDAAEEYYWHGDESVDFHNTLMEAVETAHGQAAPDGDDL